MKAFGLILVNILAPLWQIIPGKLREYLLTGLLVLDSRCRRPEVGLSRLLKHKDRVDWIINERAMVYGFEEHPKHRLTQYHKFFIDRIAEGDHVLDIGCGYGAVSRSIALARPQCIVLGVDQDISRLNKAKNSNNLKNLNFVQGNVTEFLPKGKWDIVVLSNVLEHISDRVGLLLSIKQNTRASKYLIRVPLFERDWQMALRRELGINYLSDDDHKIEHTLVEFYSEVEQAQLVAIEVLTIWGEIWAVCRPLAIND